MKENGVYSTGRALEIDPVTDKKRAACELVHNSKVD